MRLSLAASARHLAAGLALLAGCGDGGLPPSDGGLPLGTWGGDNAGVIATDSVTHVHVGCTFGDIGGRVSLDRSGRFAADGSFQLRAYPVVLGPTVPARFSGRVVGRTLTLSVSVDDTTTGRVIPLGPIQVRLGVAPRMGPCPICRVPKKPIAGAAMPNEPSPDIPERGRAQR